MTAAFLVPLIGRADSPKTQISRWLDGRRATVVAVDENSGHTAHVMNLETMKSRSLSDDTLIQSPVFSSDGRRVLYREAGQIKIRPVASGPAQPLTTDDGKKVSGYGNRWWTDSNGDEWVYYATDFAVTRWPDDDRGIKTYRTRVGDGTTELVLDWKTSAGPSLDGTHIASEHHSVIIFDGNGDEHIINDGEQGCYGSMSPDNRYLLMHQDGPHDRILVRNKEDKLVWQLQLPPGTNYINGPRWSNDPDFAVFAAREENENYSIFIVRLSEIDPRTGRAKAGKTAFTRLLDARDDARSWTLPDLWIESRTKPVKPDDKDPTTPSSPLPDEAVAEVGGCQIAPRQFDGLGCLLCLLFLLRRRGPVKAAKGAILAGSAALLLVGCHADDRSAAKAGSIAGAVFAEDEPLKGARVTFNDTETYTSEEGEFVLEGLPVREGNVTASYAWYMPSAESITVPVDGPASVELSLQPWPLRIDPTDRDLATTYNANLDWKTATTTVSVIDEIPTRRLLDNAVYERNPAIYRPSTRDRERIVPTVLPTVDDGGGHGFPYVIDGGPYDSQQALAAETIVDDLAATPLSATDQAHYMIWKPMLKWLLHHDLDSATTLTRVGVAITNNTWDTKSSRPQRIERVYLHTDTGQLWIKMTLDTTLAIGSGISDSDGDGQPEVYAALDPAIYATVSTADLRQQYIDQQLTTAEAGEAIEQQVNDLYSTTAAVLHSRVGEPVQVEGLGTLRYPFAVIDHAEKVRNVLLVGQVAPDSV